MELHTDRQTDRQTDDPITRCPRRTFQAGGIKSRYHVQYESSITSGKVMAKVKVFCLRIQYGRGREHQGYDVSFPDIRPGSLKLGAFITPGVFLLRSEKT